MRRRSRGGDLRLVIEAEAQEGRARRLVFSSDVGQLEGPALAVPRVWLRSAWDVDGEARFSFSLDGRRYRDLGPAHKLGWGHYRGDRISLFTFNPKCEAGHSLFERFDYDLAGQNGRFLSERFDAPAA